MLELAIQASHSDREIHVYQRDGVSFEQPGELQFHLEWIMGPHSLHQQHLITRSVAHYMCNRSGGTWH